MERTITATVLARDLSGVLSQVRYRGDRFVVERNGEPIAVTGPVGTRGGITMRGLIARLGDLTLPGGGFADAREPIQAARPPAETDAWPA